MSLHCYFHGHEPVRLNAIENKPIVTISDITGDLVYVEMCWRCKQVYWTAAQPKAKWEVEIKQAAQQSVQRMGVWARLKKWFGAIAHR